MAYTPHRNGSHLWANYNNSQNGGKQWWKLLQQGFFTGHFKLQCMDVLLVLPRDSQARARNKQLTERREFSPVHLLGLQVYGSNELWKSIFCNLCPFCFTQRAAFTSINNPFVDLFEDKRDWQTKKLCHTIQLLIQK